MPRRAASIVVAILLASVGVVLAPTPDATAATNDPAPTAASWLAMKVVDGKYLDGGLGPDVGLTIDALLAFAAAGVGGDTVPGMVNYLTQPDVMNPYTRFAFVPGGPDAFNAGELGKLVLALDVAGASTVVPDGTGASINLVDELRGLMRGDGLFQNSNADAFDDTNGFDQALAMLALARTQHEVPDDAVSFVATSMCEDQKGFPAFYGAARSCPGSVDTTAMLVQALLAAGSSAAITAAHAGVAWLLTMQDPATGGFVDGSPVNLTQNTNSTGLAAQALRAAGETAAADKAVAFIRGLQVGCDGAAAQRGGIAYDALGFPLADVRATAQAVLGVVRTSLNEISMDGAKQGLTPIDCSQPMPTDTETTTDEPTVAPTTVDPTTTEPAATEPATTEPATAEPTAAVTTTPPTVVAAPRSLPRTGVPVGRLAATAAALVLAGVVLVVGLRPRRRTD